METNTCSITRKASTGKVSRQITPCDTNTLGNEKGLVTPKIDDCVRLG